jgi:hypothetical protein
MASTIYLNTDDAAAGSTPSNATFIIPQLTGSNLVRYSISVDSVQFANTSYPISADRSNNVLYFQENNDTGTTYSGTLTTQNYNGTTFASEIQSILNTNTGNAYTYTVSYDSSTKKLTISEAGNNPFLLLGSSGGADSVYREVGWLDSDSTFKVAATELAFPIDISGSKYVDLFSSLSCNNVSTSSTGNVLMRIPLTASFGDLQFFSNNVMDRISLNSDTFSNFRFQLRDDRGYEFILSDYSPVSYSIKFLFD